MHVCYGSSRLHAVLMPTDVEIDGLCGRTVADCITARGSHGIHSFAARCRPTLPGLYFQYTAHGRASTPTGHITPVCLRGVHGDGILVPSPPIPADFTPIPTRPRTDSDPPPPISAKSSIYPHKPPHIFCQPKAVITVTIVAILKNPTAQL